MLQTFVYRIRMEPGNVKVGQRALGKPGVCRKSAKQIPVALLGVYKLCRLRGRDPPGGPAPPDRNGWRLLN